MLTLEISKFSDAKQWLKLRFKCLSCRRPLQSRVLYSDDHSTRIILFSEPRHDVGDVVQRVRLMGGESAGLENCQRDVWNAERL